LQNELDIPTICQKLFYRDVELEDNSATVESLEILANDVLTLSEVNEDEGMLESDDDAVDARKRRRPEGNGFGGTLLAGTSPVRELNGTSGPTDIDEQSPVDADGTVCSMCTFRNVAGLDFCAMCDSPFDSFKESTYIQ
jgi:hypothetical protein